MLFRGINVSSNLTGSKKRDGVIRLNSLGSWPKVVGSNPTPVNLKIMYFKKRKKEVKTTVSRKYKKTLLKKLYFSTFNSKFYLTSIRYNLLKYFLTNQLIKLNNKVVFKLSNEELGFIFSLNNWIFFYYKKNY